MKYKYKNPSSKEEYLEAIYEEFSKNEISNIDNRTLKTYVFEILKRQREHDWNKKREAERKDFNVSWAMVILAIIALFFIINGSRESHDISWLQQNSFAIRIWGVALATLYVGITIERFSVFSSFWQFGFTKLIVSIGISGLLIFSTGKAAGAINTVFGVDASAFPFTLTFISGVLFFHYLLPFFSLVGILAVISAINAIGWIKSKFNDSASYELPPVHSFIFPFVALILLGFFWGWSKNEFSENELPAKIYKLAHMLDFNKKHECGNIIKGVPVVYLGASQEVVLADIESNDVENVKSFFETKINVPDHFYRLNCRMPEYRNK